MKSYINFDHTNTRSVLFLRDIWLDCNIPKEFKNGSENSWVVIDYS